MVDFEKVTGYHLSIYKDSSGNYSGFVSFEVSNPSEPDMGAYWENKRFVIDYLNGDSFFGVSLNEGNVPASKLPTDAEKNTLQFFVDEYVVERNFASFNSFSAGGDLSLDVKMAPRIDGESGALGWRYFFPTATDLFRFECVEAMQATQRIAKCRVCGRYFYPKKGKGMYCSSACKARATDNKSPAYKAYRTANAAKGSYKQRHRDNMDIVDRYKRWQIEALAAMQSCERGEITWKQYAEVLQRDIKEDRI